MLFLSPETQSKENWSLKIEAFNKKRGYQTRQPLSLIFLKSLVHLEQTITDTWINFHAFNGDDHTLRS
jgi:hypothetical protein